MSGPERTITLNDENALFYILNIFHDVIHDYGPGSDDRWRVSQQIIKNFYQAQVGGHETEMDIDADQPIFAQPQPRNFFSKGIITPQTKFLAQAQPDHFFAKGVNAPSIAPSIAVFDDAVVNFNKCLNNIKNQFEFNVFNMIVNNRVPTDLSQWQNCIATSKYIIGQYRMQPDVKDPDIDELYNAFVYNFMLVLNIVNNNHRLFLRELMPNNHLFYCLQFFIINYFNDNVAEVLKLPTNILSMTGGVVPNKKFKEGVSAAMGRQKRTDASQLFRNVAHDALMASRRGMSVPVDKPMKPMKPMNSSFENIEQQRVLIAEIDSLLSTDVYILTLNGLWSIIEKDDRTNDDIISYTTNRTTIQMGISQIFKKYNQNKDAEQANDLINVCTTRTRMNQLQSFKESYAKKSNEITYKIRMNVLNDDLAKEAEISHQLKLAADLIAGNLTPLDKNVKSQFCAMIAQLGLYLTGVCNQAGIVDQSFGALGANSFLRKEIDILLYQADWHKQDSQSSFGKVSSQALDTLLYDFTTKQYMYREIKPEILTHKLPTSACVINNAALITSDNIKNHIFCPYTSILDGMTQCSFNKATNDNKLEWAENMNFKVVNNTASHYYNGIAYIDNQNSHVKYTIRLRTPIIQQLIQQVGVAINSQDDVTDDDYIIVINNDVKNNDISIETDNMKLDGIDLEAWKVIQNTLLSILQDVQSTLPNDNVFDIMFKLITGEMKSDAITQIKFLKSIFKILIKGSGDIYQEMNAVCKYGGWSSKITDTNVVPFVNGNAYRIFVANDRPSAIRVMFLLTNGTDDDINTSAVGGYMSLDNTMIIGRPSTSSHGGRFSHKNKRRISHKNKRRNKNKNTIRRNKI